VLCVQVESADLSSHAVELLDKHFDVIFTKVAGVERAIYGPQRSRVAAAATSAEHSLTDRLADIEVNVRRLDEAVQTSAVGHAGDATLVAPPAAAAAAAAGSDVQSILVSTSEKMTIYEGVITVLNREVEKLSTQVCPSQLAPAQTNYSLITHFSSKSFNCNNNNIFVSKILLVAPYNCC